MCILTEAEARSAIRFEGPARFIRYRQADILRCRESIETLRRHSRTLPTGKIRDRWFASASLYYVLRIADLRADIATARELL